VAYPALGQHTSTRVTPLPGTRVVVAPNGQVGSQERTSALCYGILCVHGVVTAAEWATVQAFYLANCRSLFDWTAAESGVTYNNVAFIGAGLDWSPRAGGNFWLQATMQTSP
jgi:hypothetical protein